MIYKFTYSALDEKTLLGDLYRVFEKRLELFSREKMPGVWEKTDRLNNKAKAPDAVIKKRKKRAVFNSLMMMCSSTILLLISFVVIGKFNVLSVLGLIIMALGLLNLLALKEKPKVNKRIAKQVAQFIKSYEHPQVNESITFKADGIYDNDELQLDYSSFKYLMKSDAFVFLVFEAHIVILKCEDLVCGNIQGFVDDMNTWTGVHLVNVAA